MQMNFNYPYLDEETMVFQICLWKYPNAKEIHLQNM